jgi:hypothetical protein
MKKEKAEALERENKLNLKNSEHE